MPCKHVALSDGTHALVRVAAKRPRTCSVCRRKTADFRLCDYRLGVASAKPKTCDAVLCKACAHHIEPDTDYCPVHAAAVKNRLKL
jgi:hypothetical protein